MITIMANQCQRIYSLDIYVYMYNLSVSGHKILVKMLTLAIEYCLYSGSRIRISFTLLSAEVVGVTCSR